MKGNRKTGGFTLMEMLLAFVILGIITSVIYSSLRIGMNVWNRAEERMEGIAEARIALERVSLSVRNAYLPRERKKILPMAFKNDTDQDESSDELRIITAAAPQRDDEYPQGGLKEVVFYLERESGEGTMVLKQRERRGYYIPEEERPLSEQTEPGVVTVLAEEVAGLNFRFFDGEKWVDEWDFEQLRKLPNGVEITIVLVREGKRQVLSTTVDLPSARFFPAEAPEFR